MMGVAAAVALSGKAQWRSTTLSILRVCITRLSVPIRRPSAGLSIWAGAAMLISRDCRFRNRRLYSTSSGLMPRTNRAYGAGFGKSVISSCGTTARRCTAVMPSRTLRAGSCIVHKSKAARPPENLDEASFEEREGQFSPDGKWIAYQSNESGRFEIYVQPFPGPGGKFQISTKGGAQRRWNKNGKEIFYVSLDSKMMAAPVKLMPDGPSLETAAPGTLFPVRIAGGPLPGVARQQYAVSSDGQRFLVNLEVDEGTASPITLNL